MSVNEDISTITLDENSDFLNNLGMFFIHDLRKTALEKGSPARLLNDWKIIESWLGCEGRDITSIEEDKISQGWKAYLAIGVAPSFKLQEAFDDFSKQYGNSFKDYKPPSEVMDVFDRLLAVDKEIADKQNYDWAKEKKKFEAHFKKFPMKKLTIKQKLVTISKNTRVFITGSVTWFVWVVFRTSDDWEILGIDLDEWDDKMFFVNTALPILGVWLGFKAYKWVISASK